MLQIRRATVDDVPLLAAMIRELAEFERESEFCVIRESDLARDGFGKVPLFDAFIAEWNTAAAGYAVFFECYSTWVGPELYLEDLYVRPQFRGQGIGISLLRAVARKAIEEKKVSMRWEVLNWNERAIKLYESLGAELRRQWRSVILTEEPLRHLAERRG